MTADNSPLSAADLKEYQEISILQSEMRRMLLERYQQNLVAFAHYMPQIARYFSVYKPTEKLDFFCTHNGVPNLYFADRKEVFYKFNDPLLFCEEQVRHYLHDECFVSVRYLHEHDFYGQIHYRYLNECVNIVKNYPSAGKLSPSAVGSMPNCIMLGLGLGYQLDYLYSQVEIYNLIVVEPNADLFYASLHAFNWAPLLKYLFDNHYGIKLLIGVNEQDLFRDLYEFYDRHGRFLSGFYFSYVHYQSELIERLKAEIKRDYTRNFHALGFFDDHLFAISHGCYAVSHQAQLLRGDREIADVYKQKPAFLVGSGPSLDQDLDFLRRNQDKALIFACGTALDCLYHAGIVPDFYCCTERTPDVGYSLELINDPDYFDQITLLATDVVHPRVLRLFKHQALFAKLDEPFYWAELYHHPELLNWRPAIMINPLVGNMGLSGALHLGFTRLYLFGYDYGKRSTFARMHSKESILYQMNGAESGGNYHLTETIEGNFGGEIETNKLYLLSIHMFEDLLAQFAQTVKCVNCSDGAKLRGVSPCRSADLEREFVRFEAIDKAGFKSSLEQDLTFTLRCADYAFSRDLDKPGFASVVEKLCNYVQHRPQSRSAYVEMLQTISEYISQMCANPAEKGHGYTLYGTIQSMFLMVLRALYHSPDEASCLNDANRILDFYVDFLNDAMRLYEYLPEYVLGEHLSLLKDKLGFDHDNSLAPKPPVPRVPPPPQGTPERSCFKKRYS